MSVMERHTPGDFCWAELGTSDPAGAKAFYSGLFGWTPDDLPIGEGMVYTMLKLEGLEVGALCELNPEQRQHGVPPHWMLYVSVESADAAAARARELGAKVVVEPFDVFDSGRMAVLQDPQGAYFSVWQPKQHIGARLAGQLGTLCWSELATTDTAAARTFYTALFGWGFKIGEGGPVQYTEWINAGKHMGGMLEMTAEWGGAPPHWMPYFLVAGCDSSAAKATDLGGNLMVPPTDIPNVGRFATVKDPQGAVFSIFQLTAAH